MTHALDSAVAQAAKLPPRSRTFLPPFSLRKLHPSSVGRNRSHGRNAYWNHLHPTRLKNSRLARPDRSTICCELSDNREVSVAFRECRARAPSQNSRRIPPLAGEPFPSVATLQHLRLHRRRNGQSLLVALRVGRSNNLESASEACAKDLTLALSGSAGKPNSSVHCQGRNDCVFPYDRRCIYA